MLSSGGPYRSRENGILPNECEPRHAVPSLRQGGRCAIGCEREEGGGIVVLEDVTARTSCLTTPKGRVCPLLAGLPASSPG